MKVATLKANVGPQWQAARTVTNTARALNERQALRVRDARSGWTANGGAAGLDAALRAISGTGRDSVFVYDYAVYLQDRVLYSVLIDTVAALAARDLIGKGDFTADHYRTLTRAWAQTMGPAHADDVKDGLA